MMVSFIDFSFSFKYCCYLYRKLPNLYIGSDETVMQLQLMRLVKLQWGKTIYNVGSDCLIEPLRISGSMYFQMLKGSVSPSEG